MAPKDRRETGNHGLEKGFASLLRTMALTVGVGLLFGVMMALVSNGFVAGVRLLSGWRESQGWLAAEIGGVQLSLAPLLALLIAACLVLLVRRLFSITRFHGPADSIYAAHRTDNELDVRAGLGSTLVAFISAGGGASVGQYGPLVHFGATIGSALRQITGGRISTDVFIGCGVAGAIAAGFNAPIAGLIFAHEAILRHFSLRAMTPIAISSITAAGVSHWAFGDSHAFSIVSAGTDTDTGSLIASALIIGPAFGLVAILFMTSIRLSAGLAAKSGAGPTRLILMAAVGTGFVGMVLPEVLGLGSSGILAILDGQFDLVFLVFLLLGKIFATALCIGFGLFGGVFSPALFVGAAAGGLAALVLAKLGVLATGPGLVICGMAAVASAVMGAPVTAMLIMLEMTQSYSYAVASMMAVASATLVSYLLFGNSFFDRQLRDRGIDISQGRGHLAMMELAVAELASDDFVALKASYTPAEAIRKMADAGASEGYIIGPENRFDGKVTLYHLLQAKDGEELPALALEAPVSIKHDASLQQAIEVASQFVGESIPLINRDSGLMLGVVTEADLFQLYLQTQNRVTDLERA